VSSTQFATSHELGESLVEVLKDGWIDSTSRLHHVTTTLIINLPGHFEYLLISFTMLLSIFVILWLSCVVFLEVAFEYSMINLYLFIFNALKLVSFLLVPTSFAVNLLLVSMHSVINSLICHCSSSSVDILRLYLKDLRLCNLIWMPTLFICESISLFVSAWVLKEKCHQLEVA